MCGINFNASSLLVYVGDPTNEDEVTATIKFWKANILLRYQDADNELELLYVTRIQLRTRGGYGTALFQLSRGLLLSYSYFL